MTDPSHDLFEQMKADWQQTATPTLTVEAVRQRLRWRWLSFGLDGLGLIVAVAIIAWSTTWMSGLLEWIYWSFFLVVFAAAAAATIHWRLRALWRPDDSLEAVLDHARRDARLRQRAGRLAILLSIFIALFVAAWMAIAGWLDPAPTAEFLRQRVANLVFAALWCLLGASAGAWIREKGRRQSLEIERLDDELSR